VNTTLEYLTAVRHYLRAMVAAGAEDETTMALLRATEFRLAAVLRRQQASRYRAAARGE
jgi:hypothetical protein